MEKPNKYSFTSSIVTAIPFDIPDENGKPLKYIFMLPSADDFTPVNTRAKRREELQAQLDAGISGGPAEEAINKELKELSDADDDFMDSLMQPNGHTIRFKDAFKKVPVPVVRAVNKMIEDEMGFKAA